MFRSIRSWALLSMLSLGCAAVGCTDKRTASEPKAQPSATEASPVNLELQRVQFADVTKSSGVVSVYRNGFEAGENSILESLGGGVGTLDYDLDGLPDLFFPTGGDITKSQTIVGSGNQLYQQKSELVFADVSDTSRIDLDEHCTHGCAIADADNDGFADILVTGYAGLQFYLNQGDGTFIESADALGLNDDQWSSSAAWGDFNADGLLDLYVTHYVNWSWENHPKCHVTSAEIFDICSPHQFEGLSDCIFLAQPDGTYQELAAEVGLVAGGKGLGVLAGDVDLDGDVDIYVANDTENNFLYLNDGTGRFSEMGLSSGVATDGAGVPNGSMGLAMFDFKNDLQPDLWVTNYENETFGLYENMSDASFKSVSDLAGVTALGTLFVGFGTVACDLDLDGDEDVAVANGHVINFPKTGKPSQYQLVLVNTGNRLERALFADDSYFSTLHLGRGVIAPDLDNDGLLDLVFSNSNEPAGIIRNQSLSEDRNWLKVRLVGRGSNRDAIGARVTIHTAGGDQLRCVVGGGSYLSQNNYVLHWGVPNAAKIDELQIVWPDGSPQTLKDFAVNQEHTIAQPPEALPPGD